LLLLLEVVFVFLFLVDSGLVIEEYEFNMKSLILVARSSLVCNSVELEYNE